MESSLVGSATAASLCATAAATRRSAGSRGGARFLSCSCSSRDDPAARGWPVSTSSVGRRLRSVAPGRSLGGSSPQLAGVNGWNGNGSDRRWMALGDSFVLEAREDEYGGMLVDADRLPPDTAAFARSLALSLAYWKSARKKGVWLKLPLDRSEYVPLAVKEGFKYHHAEESYVMLTYWIPDEPCMLPANASHQVGVGGFVINDQMEVLVVQEKYTASTLLGAWKLPTGFILASEEIYTGAVREVKEETGARAQRGVPKVRPVLHLHAEASVRRHHGRRRGNPSGKVDAAGGVRGAAVHPGGRHVQEDHRHLRAAPPQALLRAGGEPRDLQVRRRDVHLVLQRRRSARGRRLRRCLMNRIGSDRPGGLFITATANNAIELLLCFQHSIKSDPIDRCVHRFEY